MKRIIVVTLILWTTALFAQDNQFPAKFSTAQEAPVLPNLSLFASAGSDIVPRDMSVFRGQAKLGIADVVEVGILQQETVMDFFAVSQFVPQLELKVQVLHGSSSSPSIAVLYRTTLSWKEQQITEPHILQARSNYTTLYGARYEFALSSGSLLLSQDLFSYLQLTVGFGFQDVQTKSLWMYPAPFFGYGTSRRDTKHETTFSGLFQAAARIQDNVAVYAEGESIPVIWPDPSKDDLSFDRAYLMELGVRYMPLPALALDMAVSHHTAFQGITGTNLRLSVSSFLDLTKLK